jgi:hypothetical protein
LHILINEKQNKMNNSNLDFQEKNSIRCYINGVSNIIKNNPELELQKMVDDWIWLNGFVSIKELNSKEAMNLNIAVQKICWKHEAEKSRIWKLNNPQPILSKEEQENKVQRTLEMMLESGPLD